MLIEIMVSTLLVALIVVAVLSGFDTANKVTADQRAQSVADQLAQQSEDQLRGEPISALNELEGHPRVAKTTANGTVFTTTAYVEFRNDATATSSCSSTTAKADYLLSSSEVTWPAHGVRPPVVERGIISPPPDSTILAQVTDENANGVGGASVAVTGSTSRTLETSSAGCATFSLLPGEYSINASKSGYVTPNWYANTSEDNSFTHKTYVTAENTTKIGVSLAPAGKLEVQFSGGSIEGDAVLVHGSNMLSPKLLGKAETYTTKLSSGQIVYPGKYTVYAGTCESDIPTPVPTAVEVPANGSVTTTVTEPPVNIKVMSGNSLSPGSKVSGALVYVKDNNCGTTRSFSTNSEGALQHPALPYGSYTFCASFGNKTWEDTALAITSASGPSGWTNGGTSGGVSTIYLGSGTTGSCP